MNNYTCKCGHSQENHYSDTGCQHFPMMITGRGTGYCTCMKYERDNLRFLEDLSDDKA